MPHDKMEGEDRLRFETLLADLSARFINLPVDEVDGAIAEAQRLVCDCLGLDLSSLWQWDADRPASFILTHYYRPLGGPPVPERMDAAEHFPWSKEQAAAGRVVVISSTENSPAEASADVAAWRYYGIRTVLNIPLSAGGGAPFGVVSFNDMRSEREWSEPLIKRLRLVAQVFSNAIVRCRTERALRESEERLVLATSAAGIGLWILNPARTQFWVNAMTADLWDLPPGDVIDADRIFSLIHPDDRDRVWEAMALAVEAREMSTVEYRIVRPDGEVRWLQSCGRPCRVSGHEAARLMGVTVDITARKLAELDAQRLQRELAHVTRVASMGMLAASLAHEINQPLTAILANAQAARRLLDSGNPDMQEIRDILTDIAADDQRAGEVIRRVRSLMRKDEHVFKSVDTGQVIREAIGLVSAEALIKGVTVAVDLTADLPAVRGDAVQLQQVLINLVVNAFDALKNNVRVKELAVRGRPAGGGVEVIVEDSGPGIPPDRLESVFEPFYTSKPDGMGMGLAICRSIVAAHGGRIWAGNRREGGAAFRFVLPAAGESKP